MFTRLDTAIESGNGKVYLFNGANYERFDVRLQKVEFEQNIVKEWDMEATKEVLKWTQSFDAALNLGNGKVYFFKDQHYIRYDLALDRAEEGWPKLIKDEWEGLFQNNFNGRIDAALNWWNGKVYFFKGDSYVRYDIDPNVDRVEEGWPKKISDHWPGVFSENIDAAVNWGDGKVYFFRRNQYIRFDIATNKADLGPVNISENFSDLSASNGALRGIAWGQRVSAEFREKVVNICTNLEMEPSYLMAAIAFETGKTFSPSIQNKQSGATGLIQFMQPTAQALGTTTTALAAMTAVRQLDFVERYFARFKGRLRTLGDVYMAILFPIAVGKPADFVLFSNPSATYTQNAGLDTNKDGKVTKSEAEVSVRKLLAEGLNLAM